MRWKAPKFDSGFELFKPAFTTMPENVEKLDEEEVELSDIAAFPAVDEQPDFRTVRSEHGS